MSRAHDLVLTFCWREWRAQRSVLLAYTGMGLAALCLVFLLIPEHWWREDGRRALTLSWFVAIGLIGAIAFVAPALVRGEYGTKHDHFVRRLPGALLPSFGGKLLFLALSTAALPLACLLVGEGFLLAIDEPWHKDLFRWDYTGRVYFEWVWPAITCGYAALLIPWVWAIGTWMPGGRMAIGGVILFALVLGTGVFAVMRQSPGIMRGIDWEWWLWTVPVIGLAVAAVSWAKGRRGGGPLRSARFGLTAAAIGFVPSSVWLADRVWEYHHPDLQNLVKLDVRGLSPDHNFALATAAGHDEYQPVLVRIDLRDARAEQLEGIYHWYTPELQKPYALASHGQHRYWRIDGYDGWNETMAGRSVLDLATGERAPCSWDQERMEPVLPESISPAVAMERRQKTPLRAPGDTHVWFDRGELVFADPTGRKERAAWNGALPVSFRAIGHGLDGFMPGGTHIVFDLTTRAPVTVKTWAHGFLVRGVAMFVQNGGKAGSWWRQEGAASAQRVEALQGCQILGLLDDDHLVCTSWRARQMPRLFLLRVADETVTELVLPRSVTKGSVIEGRAPLFETGSLLARDPSGRVWMSAHNGDEEVFLRLDPATRDVTSLLPNNRRRGNSLGLRLLGWPDADSVLVQDDTSIVRIDVANGERTVLFPRR